MKMHLMWLPATALALVLGGQVALYSTQAPTTELHASWAYKPKSLTEASDKAESIVDAEVVAVAPGADIVTPAPGEPNNEDRIPTQVITLKVLESVKGRHQAGDQIQLFQTGGAVTPDTVSAEPSKDQVRIQAKKVILEGDPPYTVGERHLLMLDQGPRGLQKIIAPQGRFKVERGGTLTPTVQDEVTLPARGKSLQEFKRLSVPERGRLP